MEQQTNLIEVDLQTGAMHKQPLALSDKQIETSATILSNILLDYVKQYGDTCALSPDKVFGKGANNE